MERGKLNTILIMAIATIVLAVYGCGGGGGGGGGGAAPNQPTGVSAVAGDGEVTISWNAVSGATSYNIYWSATSGVTKTNGTKITGATSPYTHTGLTNDTTYYYVVTAVNASGESADSAQVSATPITNTPITSSAQASSAATTGASTATVSANMGQTLSSIASPQAAPKFRSALAGKDPRFVKLNNAVNTAMKAPKSKLAEFRKAQGYKAIPYSSTTYDCTTWQETTTATDNIMTMDISLNNDLTSFQADITYKNCRTDTTRLNGTIIETFTASGQTTSFTTKIGNGNNTIDSADFVLDLYQDSVSTISYATLSMDLTETGTENNAVTPPSYSLSANGKMEYLEGSNSYAISMTNIDFDYTEDTAGKVTVTANGTLGQSWTEGTVSKSTSIKFENFITTEDAALDNSYVDYTADGKVTVTNIGFCSEGSGTWVIVTNTPIRELSTGVITAGKMTINTNTVIEFQPDGSVKVTLGSETPTTMPKTDFDAIAASCAIEDFEYQAP